MKRFGDKPLLSRQPWSVAVNVLVLLSLLLHPVSVFAKPVVAPRAEDLAIGAPVLRAPESGAKTTGITYPPLGVPKLEWEPVATAQKYGVEVSASAGFATTLVKVETFGTTYTPLKALADGEYFWRIRAYDGKNWGPYSEIRSFIKDWNDGGNSTVELLSPPDGAQRASFTKDDFIWQPLPGAARYRFQIATDPAFSNVVYLAQTVKAQHTPTKRLPNNLYYWRVTPIDNQRNFGAPSAVRSFSFAWNNTPLLLSPAPDVELAFVPRFTWTAVEAARIYELQISTQPDFGIKSFYQTAHTDYTPENALSNDQDYYWRVKAIDSANISSPWSEVRRFRAKWNFQTQLLAPVHSTIKQSNPFFAWTPIPGAERYEVRVAANTAFFQPTMDTKFANVTTAAILQFANPTVYADRDYYWQVRGIDAQGNNTPWSDMHTFRFNFEDVSPNLIYPLPYYVPDAVNQPVHSDRTIADPLFVWDSSPYFSFAQQISMPPAYYVLTVAGDPAFQAIQFQIETTGPAAAPTLTHPFTNLQDGKLYYWRVRAYNIAGQQLGVDHIWVTRIDRTVPQFPSATSITPIYPRDAFETVSAPPILGWLPVDNAANYRVQISRDPNFNTIVDEAAPQFVNYAPWQGRRTTMPFGTYWWRVRAESAPNVALGGWSEVRRFNLSVSLITGNPNDLVPPAYPSSIFSTTSRIPVYTPDMSYIASSAPTTATLAPGYALGELHMMSNRIDLKSALYPSVAGSFNWLLAFDTDGALPATVKYGIYVDSDHVANSGAPTDPLGKAITVDSLYWPEYVIYITPNASGTPITPDNVLLYSWLPQIQSWDAGKSFTSIGGDAWYSTDGKQAIQLQIPYGAIGTNAENFPGSLAVTLFSTTATDTTGMVDTIPPQGATLTQPAFMSSMVMPLYPFDTPLTNPITYYDMPPLRWRIPYSESTDGYQVQVARDAKFTQLVETWEQFEQKASPLYSFVANTFQSTNPYDDNESYYWRVRVRHEKYNTSEYDYGPWSPAMRFKLDSRLVGNPRLSTGALANTTPTFTWDRVESASIYKIQIANDVNFSRPLIDLTLSGTSYTPIAPLKDGTYYWRVATMRSKNVTGRWTPTMSFVKQSLAPVPLAPTDGAIVNAQPTFAWTAILTPTAEPRIATALYQLQIDKDPNFGAPVNYTTAATALTLPDDANLTDGTWYWRVAAVDSDKGIGAYSPMQKFYKEYLAPQLLQPGQNSTISGVTSFEWAPVAGAAYYGIQIDDDKLFNSLAVDIETDNTKYTPIVALPAKEYYWRVRIFDVERQPGPFVTGRIQVQTVSLSVGNYAWIDENDNGIVDSGEQPVPDGVIVELLSGAGSPLNKTTQTVNGYYRFTGLDIGEYRVRLAASNFIPGGLLQKYGHSLGANQESDPNLDGDQNDNGLDTTEPAVDGIVSGKFSLTQSEPTNEQPTASGNPGDDGAGTADTDSNLTIDFGVSPSSKFYSIGNFVGLDANNDGQIDLDSTQKPMPVPDGVLLELLTGDSTPLLTAATTESGDGVTVLRTTTTQKGYYLFSGLPAGNYRLRIAASNFAGNGVLATYGPSTGADQEVDPNNNGDQNDNGLDEGTPAINGITSGVITLGDNEPTGEPTTAVGQPGDDGRGTLDANANLTIDFALMPGKPTAATQRVYLPVIRR